MDRTFRGLLAGTTGAVVMNSLNLIFYYLLDLTEIRFLDWAGIAMLGSRPTTKPAIIYALIIQILWTGSLGVLFCYLIPKITSQGYLIKGWLYAFLITFIFRWIIVLYNVPLLANVSFQTSLINTLSASTWGLILAAGLQKFDANQPSKK